MSASERRIVSAFDRRGPLHPAWRASLALAPFRPRSSPEQKRSAAAGRKPNSVSTFARALRHELRWMTTIPLGPALLTGSSDLPGGFQRAVVKRLPIWPCSVRGFACHLSYDRCGALLPHLFTIACLRPLGRRHGRPCDLPLAVYFLCHCPSGCPDRELPGALPCGVRTFLPPSRLFEPLRRASPQKRRHFSSADLERPAGRSAKREGRRSSVPLRRNSDRSISRRFPA
jgi:hypothetical protein